MSFKWGDDELIDDRGRYFNNYTFETLHKLILQIENFAVIDEWIETKPLREIEQKWVNILLKRIIPTRDQAL